MSNFYDYAMNFYFKDGDLVVIRLVGMIADNSLHSKFSQDREDLQF